MKRLFTALSLMILLAACQPRSETPLVVPTQALSTPIVDAADSTIAPTQLPAAPQESTAPAPTAETSNAEPTAAAPTATLPIPIIATKPRATPAIVVPPPIDEPVNESANVELQVAFVELGDTLNVRSGPGAGFPIVNELPPDATGLVMDDATQALVSGSTWVHIEGPDASGYVNSRYLTETVMAAEFCGNAEMDAVLENLRQAVANRDGAQLAALVHPERGLRLRHNWWNEEIRVPAEAAGALFSDGTSYEWGTADGSGLPIIGTFSEVMLPLLDKDLTAAQASACDELLSGPTAGMVVVPEGYEAIPFVSYYRASTDVEFDWGTWVVGVERWDGHYYLSYLVHYAYEI